MLCVQERRKLGLAVATVFLTLLCSLSKGFTGLGGAVLSHLILSEPREPALSAGCSGSGHDHTLVRLLSPFPSGPLLPGCPPEPPPVIPRPVGLNVRVGGKREVLGDKFRGKMILCEEPG